MLEQLDTKDIKELNQRLLLQKFDFIYTIFNELSLFPKLAPKLKKTQLYPTLKNTYDSITKFAAEFDLHPDAIFDITKKRSFYTLISMSLSNKLDLIEGNIIVELPVYLENVTLYAFCYYLYLRVVENIQKEKSSQNDEWVRKKRDLLWNAFFYNNIENNPLVESLEQINHSKGNMGLYEYWSLKEKKIEHFLNNLTSLKKMVEELAPNEYKELQKYRIPKQEESEIKNQERLETQIQEEVPHLEIKKEPLPTEQIQTPTNNDEIPQIKITIYPISTAQTNIDDGAYLKNTAESLTKEEVDAINEAVKTIKNQLALFNYAKVTVPQKLFNHLKATLEKENLEVEPSLAENTSELYVFTNGTEYLKALFEQMVGETIALIIIKNYDKTIAQVLIFNQLNKKIVDSYFRKSWMNEIIDELISYTGISKLRIVIENHEDFTKLLEYLEKRGYRDFATSKYLGLPAIEINPEEREPELSEIKADTYYITKAGTFYSITPKTNKEKQKQAYLETTLEKLVSRIYEISNRKEALKIIFPKGLSDEANKCKEALAKTKNKFIFIFSNEYESGLIVINIADIINSLGKELQDNAISSLHELANQKISAMDINQRQSLIDTLDHNYIRESIRELATGIKENLTLFSDLKLITRYDFAEAKKPEKIENKIDVETINNFQRLYKTDGSLPLLLHSYTLLKQNKQIETKNEKESAKTITATETKESTQADELLEIHEAMQDVKEYSSTLELIPEKQQIPPDTELKTPPKTAQQEMQTTYDEPKAAENSKQQLTEEPKSVVEPPEQTINILKEGEIEKKTSQQETTQKQPEEMRSETQNEAILKEENQKTSLANSEGDVNSLLKELLSELTPIAITSNISDPEQEKQILETALKTINLELEKIDKLEKASDEEQKLSEDIVNEISKSRIPIDQKEDGEFTNKNIDENQNKLAVQDQQIIKEPKEKEMPPFVDPKSLMKKKTFVNGSMIEPNTTETQNSLEDFEKSVSNKTSNKIEKITESVETPTNTEEHEDAKHEVFAQAAETQLINIKEKFTRYNVVSTISTFKPKIYQHDKYQFSEKDITFTIEAKDNIYLGTISLSEYVFDADITEEELSSEWFEFTTFGKRHIWNLSSNPKYVESIGLELEPQTIWIINNNQPTILEQRLDQKLISALKLFTAALLMVEELFQMSDQELEDIIAGQKLNTDLTNLKVTLKKMLKTMFNKLFLI